MSIIRKIKSYTSFSHEFKRILLLACYFSFIIECRLLLGLIGSYKSLYQNETSRISKIENPKTINRVRRAIKMIESNAFWRPKCHNSALTAKKIFLLHGINTNLHVGFRKKNNSVQGHAWITLGNEVIIGQIEDLNDYIEDASKAN